jgi:hypothetical protein
LSPLTSGALLMAEQEIIGTKAIAQELGVSVPGLYALIERDGFLMYRKRLARVRRGARAWAWATTPSLIRTWRAAKCVVDRQEFLAENRSSRKAPRGR